MSGGSGWPRALNLSGITLGGRSGGLPNASRQTVEAQFPKCVPMPSAPRPQTSPTPCSPHFLSPQQVMDWAQNQHIVCDQSVQQGAFRIERGVLAK